MKYVLAAMVLFVVSGCAHLTKTDSLIPVQTTGVRLTDSIAQERTVSTTAFLPDWLLVYEGAPGRLKWECAAVSEMKEHYCQVIWQDVDFKGYPVAWVLVDDYDPEESVKVMIVSTKMDHGYDLSGKNEIIVNPDEFKKDFEYKKKIVLENGTALDSKKIFNEAETKAILDSLRKMGWQRYEYKLTKEIILSPLNETDMSSIMGINPGETTYDKYVATASAPLTPSVEGIVIGNALDIIKMFGAPKRNWDRKSIATREEMGPLWFYLLKVMRDKMGELNSYNLELLRQNEELKRYVSERGMK